MKIKLKSFVLFAGVLCLMASAACAQKGDKKGKADEMKTEMDSISYILGTSLGANIRQSEIEGVVIEQVMTGLEDALEGDSATKISIDDGGKIVRAYLGEMQSKKSAAALIKSNEYMEEAAADGKLKSTESGILYEEVTAGDGSKPTPTDRVKVHYEGKTIDGKVFDSSYKRDKPAEFKVNQVIPGWTEILQLMPVGSTWIVTIPPGLGYGERGNPPKIGSNEVLIFKIELIEILPAAPKK